MRFAFYKEINERNVQYAIEKDKEEELIMKMKDMENYFNQYKKDDEKSKLYEIELQSQIKRLKGINVEKNERIRMMNEELEYFIYLYNKEKKNHSYTYNALQALEKKVLKEKEQREKEQKEKEELEKKMNEEDKNKIGTKIEEIKEEEEEEKK